MKNRILLVAAVAAFVALVVTLQIFASEYAYRFWGPLLTSMSITNEHNEGVSVPVYSNDRMRLFEMCSANGFELDESTVQCVTANGNEPVCVGVCRVH